MHFHTLAAILHDERQRRIESTLERRGIVDRAREAEAEARDRPVGARHYHGQRRRQGPATDPAA
jgi:hypothetical protein